MGQFKPMVKMETTEPSVELKLKKGGHVNMKKGGKAEAGHKKMAMGGGAMDMMMGTPALVGRPAVNAPVRAPGKPSMSMRRKAMMAKAPPPMDMPPMKKGGKAMGGDAKEDMKMDKSQDKAMIKKAFKQHDMQEHKGDKGTSLKLKKGGMKKFATGGVTNGQGGYKTGGVALGNAGGFKTGGVTLGNAGGYKMGGKTSKKAYATGGTVNSGRAVAMPQGSKPASPSVRINQLAGTYKNGGKATPAEAVLMKSNKAENATAMRQAKTQSNMKYMAGGGSTSDKEVDMSKGAVDAHYANEKADNEADRKMISDALMYLPRQAKKVFNSLTGQGATSDKEVVMPSSKKGEGAVTKTEKSVTVTPVGNKRGGRIC